MALTGSLKEFGLADILQLVHYQRKTGVLTIQSRMDKVKLLFNEGNIVYAETRRRDIENRLGRVLMKRGLIKAEALKAAIEEQKKTGAKIGAILIKKGLISQEHLREVLTFQITETAVQLFSWKEGRYEFRPEGIPVDKTIDLSISTQHLLMEGLRLLDEWSLIEGKISIDAVFEIRAGAPEAELEDEERNILEYVDGKADVGGIADLAGMDSFQVSKALLGLQEKGIVIRKEDAGAAEALAEAMPKKTQWAFKFVTAAAFSAALAISFGAYFLLSTGTGRFRASQELERLRFSQMSERLETGQYPPPPEKTDPWGTPYSYEIKDGAFILRSLGPDRIAGTEDDLY